MSLPAPRSPAARTDPERHGGSGDERLRGLLGSAALAPLFAAAHRRLEAAGGAARSVVLAGCGPETYAAVADLMGWSAVPEGALRVSLEELDRALRESAAAVPLRRAVEVLVGPLRDRREERRILRAERDRRWAEAHAAVEAAGRSELGPWLDQLQRGALARAARAAGRPEAEVLDRALRAALRLPAGGRLLTVFAGEVLGDPHALDAGTALAGLVLRAAAAIVGWPSIPVGAGGRRALWAEVGLDCDALSATALVYGLRPQGPSLLARQLRDGAEAGEPRCITLRELVRADLVVAPGEVVHVCENPAVVASAADALGPRSRPLVCTEGVPSTAVLQLLGRCVQQGARLRVRADFDWPGLRIAWQVWSLGRTEPWRFSAHDYERAVAEGRIGPVLLGGAVPVPWDPALPAAMTKAGVSVPEERLIALLVAELAR